MPSDLPATSLEKMLYILDLVEDSDGGLTYEELSEKLQLTRSTLYRYLKVLTDSGLLTSLPNVGYTLGPRISELDYKMRVRDPLIIASRPVMVELVKAIPGIALLCRKYKDKVLCVHQESGTDAFHSSYERGYARPLVRGSASRIILAYSPARTVAKLYEADPAAFADAGLGDTLEAVKASLAAIRQRGWDATSGQVTHGVTGIAAPIFDSHENVIGSLSGALPWLDQFAGRDGDVRLAAYEERDVLNSGQRISVLSKMNLYAANSRYKKYLRVDLNPEKIYSIMKREDGWLRLLLIDDRDRVVLDSASISFRTGVASSVIPVPPERGSGYVIEHTLGQAGYIKGWKLIGIADTRRIEMLHDAARRSILWLAAVSAIIPTILINVLFRSYHLRVNKLARHMARIRDERFEPIAIAEGRDEIGALIRSFNAMAVKIHSLIHEVYKLEIRQKNLELEHLRAELSALHSQVNPHFLFNTLNALYVVCVKNGYRDVASVIRDLSLLMRQMLSRGDDLIPLREELHFTAMYLQIEKFRFGDLFEYAFEVDPDANEMRIPRMSVQLLVENACKHGLQARRDNRRVAVTAKLEDQALAVTVADNGIGMEEEKLRQVMDMARSDSGGHEHVGIRNVCKRLELYYRGMAAFRIDSRPGEGTTVGFRIPIRLLIEEESKEGR